MQFKIGDAVKSCMNGDGIAKWKGVPYVGTVHAAYRTDTGDDCDGFCYVIHGRWEGDRGGLTSRQLWSKHLLPA